MISISVYAQHLVQANISTEVGRCIYTHQDGRVYEN